MQTNLPCVKYKHLFASSADTFQYEGSRKQVLVMMRQCHTTVVLKLQSEIELDNIKANKQALVTDFFKTTLKVSVATMFYYTSVFGFEVGEYEMSANRMNFYGPVLKSLFLRLPLNKFRWDFSPQTSKNIFFCILCVAIYLLILFIVDITFSIKRQRKEQLL